MPPCKLSTSWPLPRPGSLHKSQPLQLSTHSHTPRDKQSNCLLISPNVVLPGSSPGPPTQICFWIPHCRRHPSFQTQYCDISPSSPPLTSHSPPLHPPTMQGTNLTLSSQGHVVLSTLCYPTHCVLPSCCHFLSSLKIHHLPCPYTSHSHHGCNTKSISPSALLNSSFFQGETPRPPTPGNYSPYPLLSSLLLSLPFLPLSLMMALQLTLPRR